RRLRPDRRDVELADVPSGVLHRGERGAALHRAVRLDAQDVRARGATAPMRLHVTGAGSQDLLVRAEISEVIVAGDIEGNTRRMLEDGLLLDRGERVDYIDDAPRLEDPLRVLRSATHWTRELRLPRLDTECAELARCLDEVIRSQAIHLRIRCQDHSD